MSVKRLTSRIPASVRPLAIGRTLSIPVGAGAVSVTVTESMEAIRCSLRTSDPEEGKVRELKAKAALAEMWRTLKRDEERTLTHREAVALAGVVYRGWLKGRQEIAVEQDPVSGEVVSVVQTLEEAAEASRHVAEKLRAKTQAGLATEVGALVDPLLLRHGISRIDAKSRAMLVEEVIKAIADAVMVHAAEDEGDYSEPTSAKRFPAPPKLSLPFSALVDRWWAEADSLGRSRKTHEAYSATFKAFGSFLGRTDSLTVTQADVIAFKDYRLGLGVTARTIKGGDLVALRSVFGWAVTQGLLSENPAAGVTVRMPSPRQVRDPGFSDREAEALARAAWSYQRNVKQEAEWTALGKKWVPLLQAYTGARVGELGQLRPKDVRKEGDTWVLRITPEAGTTKDGRWRDVPLHPHLVELGFPQAVATVARRPYLFIGSREGDPVSGAVQALKNRLAEFARHVVPDRGVMPTHGWRHRFKTVGREAGIEERTLEAIQGHAPRSVGQRYGRVSLRTMAEAVQKLPRLSLQ